MNKKQFISTLTVLVWVLAVCFLTGCVSPITPATPTRSAPEHKFEKNYSIGRQTNSYVGEAMIKCKDYYASTVGQNKLKALNSFTITGGHLGWKLNIVGSQGQEFPVAGDIKRSGEDCYVVKPDETAGYAFIVNHNGQFTGHALNIGENVEAAYTFVIDPPSTVFQPVVSEQVDSSAGYVNFELIYTGKTSQSLNFAYREYTPDNLARPAFFQNLTYDADSKTIRFKKLKIEIGEASNEKITFTVLED